MSIGGWIFPPLCASCGGLLRQGEKQVCLGCLLRLPETLFWKVPQQNEAYYRIAPHCAQVIGAIAGFWYSVGSPLRQWVQIAKYHHQPQALYGAAQYLAALIAQEGTVPLPEIGGILPVPIAPERLKQRGYNQAEWVGRALATVWNKALLTGQWYRVSGGPSQVAKTRIERWASLRGLFRFTGELPPVVTVVDDVLTTGATLTAALSSLSPSVRIWVVTVGITQRRS